jgi:hypothetical protein
MLGLSGKATTSHCVTSCCHTLISLVRQCRVLFAAVASHTCAMGPMGPIRSDYVLQEAQLHYISTVPALLLVLVVLVAQL